MMNSFNFLHFGPGGNAYVERQLLSADFPLAHFWDRPRVKSMAQPFKAKVRITTDHLLHSHGTPVVAHSFGCDILTAVLNSQTLQTGPVVLISPIVNLPQGMYNMGLVLQKKNPQTSLESALKLFHASSPHLTPEIFWGLVSQIGTHPDYPAVFWKSPERLSDYNKIAAEGPSFDASEWQTVIQNFIFANQPPQFESLKSRDAWVIIGDSDPYINLETDVPFWSSVVGSNRVIVIKNSGHFPHIENKQEVLDILKRV